MRGSYSDKFGVWYSLKTEQFEFTKKYGETLEDAFLNIKKEICSLIVNGNINDYEGIEKSIIAPLFRGKILSTYYPEKYLSIFKEEDVDKFLNVLDINYDVYKINTLEKKKKLLVEYKNTKKYFKDKADYYFVRFLFNTFKYELEIKHTVNGEIDYNFDFVDLEYVRNHISTRKNKFRFRGSDYEQIARNKKDVGNRGERAVLNNQIEKLKKLGLNNLANQVEICENDAEGYDILSFDENGNEIHIEVKTNSSNTNYLDFYISDNELQHLKNEGNYYIYYLYNIKNKPKCHIINREEILNNKYFQPVIYKVNIDTIEKKK
jgi:hypothetical protein